jgi:hypothetical protein
VALGSGRSCANTAAAPDVTLIETTLADGTVVREMVCAGLSEHRTGAACSVPEFTKGCVGVQPGPRISLPTCRACIRTKRTTAIEPANNGPRFQLTTPVQQTQTIQETFTSKSSALAKAGGLCPPGPPRFSALRQSRRVKTETGHPERCSGVPPPVLAPGSALGSRLRVALSSDQVTNHSICDPSAEPLAVRAVPGTERCRWSSPLRDHSTDQQPASGL